MRFSQLAIFGPGLIGGSLALAARKRRVCERITVWSPDAAEHEAVRRLGIVEVVTADPVAAVRGADLLVFCTPPSAMPKLAAQVAPHLSANAVVTDVASVKTGVAEELTSIFQPETGQGNSRYVGAHPMAGAETSGLASAREDLFEGRVCLLTPVEGATAPGTTETVSEFWQCLGARVRCLSPQGHDSAVALISHLPHLLAAGLMDYVGGLPGEALECAGPGWRDMTRLAGGSPEMWTEILSRNRTPVTSALRGMIEKLQAVLEQLEAGREADLERFLRAAKQRRDDASSLPLGRSVAKDSRK